MPITVSVVNMKGGVGKSTLTANLGWYCAQRLRKRVLLVDLDPQFNLSQYSMGAAKYEEHLSSKGRSVLDVFEQYTPSVVAGVETGPVTLSDVTVNISSPYRGGRLDLIPSRLELAWTLKNPHDKEHLLRDMLSDAEEEYDLILIDCPPTESMLTTAAYLTSDYVFVPVKPEFLSTIGLPLLVRSLGDFGQRHRDSSLTLAGIVFNDSRENREYERSRRYVEDVATEQGWYVFENEVSHSDSYPAGARAGRPIFLTDYARSSKIADFIAVADEFVGRIGL